MKELLLKEIKLCLAPINYVYLTFACMTIIPNYPRYVPFFFFCVSILHLFNNALLNKDLQYSMILPITKKEIVKARCLLVAFYQIIATIITVPFSILSNNFIQLPNEAGIECNVAFYGFSLILLILFDFIFFINYYKKAEKPGLPFLKASIIFWIGFMLIEFPIWTKDLFNNQYLQLLDKTDSASLIRQIPILIFGILFFICGWILTYKISASRFEKVDL